MSSRGILSRYDAAAELAHTAGTLTPDGSSPLGAELTPTHVKAAEVLSSLLDLGGSVVDDDTPQHMRVLVTMLRRSKPMLLDGIGKIPPEQIVAFMTQLRDKIDEIVRTGPDAGSVVRRPGVVYAPEETIERGDDDVDDDASAALDRADIATGSAVERS